MPPHGSFGLADLGAPGFLQGLVLKGSNKAIRVAMRVPLRVYYNGCRVLQFGPLFNMSGLRKNWVWDEGYRA